MKKLLLFNLLILCTLISANRSYGKDRDHRKLDEFHSIHVGGGIDVFIYQDDDYRVEIESKGDPDDIVTEVNGDVLRIRYKDGWSFLKWGRDDEVHVYVRNLEEIKSSGGSDVEGRDRLTGDFLKLESSGGSDIILDVDVRELELNSSGGSDIKLSGKVRFLHAESSGGSDIKAYDLIADEADLRSSGGSDIQITVGKRISARASGGSDIFYYGEPEYVDIDSSSGGDVHHK